MDIIALCNAMLWPTFFCHFGNLTADHVTAIGQIAYNSNWFEHPVDMQKFMILIIARSHERAEFFGLHLITCSMETFGKVKTNTFKSSIYMNFFFNYFDIVFVNWSDRQISMLVLCRFQGNITALIWDDKSNAWLNTKSISAVNVCGKISKATSCIRSFEKQRKNLFWNNRLAKRVHSQRIDMLIEH